MISLRDLLVRAITARPPDAIAQPKATPAPVERGVLLEEGTQAAGVFDRAFGRTVGHEGGYVNNPADPGGETKYGISRRAYPNENIAGMTLDRAKLLYLRGYWQPARCHQMPEPIALEVFDAAVNCGVGQAVRWAQRAVGAADDGNIGPVTIAAINADPNPQAVAARILGHRLGHNADLSTWRDFGRGWARRISQQLVKIR